MLITRLTVIVLLLGLASTSSAQKRKYNGYQFTNQEQIDMHLEWSKTQKRKAFIALAAGPVLTTIGFLLYKKDPAPLVGNISGIPEAGTPTATAGLILATVGVVTTIASIPLFISSSENKRKAEILLKDQSTSFLNKRISVPSIGINISF